MNVSLTEKQKEYITSQIMLGDYQNASELVRDALRLHQLYRNKVLDELRAEVAKGWNAPDSDLGVIDVVKAKMKEHKASNG